MKTLVQDKRRVSPSVCWLSFCARYTGSILKRGEPGLTFLSQFFIYQREEKNNTYATTPINFIARCRKLCLVRASTRDRTRRFHCRWC